MSEAVASRGASFTPMGDLDEAIELMHSLVHAAHFVEVYRVDVEDSTHDELLRIVGDRLAGRQRQP